MVHSDAHKHFIIWQHIWKRQSALSALIDRGRLVYNFFLRRFLRQYVTPTTEFLELGCGTSSLNLSLAPELHKVVGLDISPQALEISRTRAKSLGIMNAVYDEGDCLKSPYDGLFDVVWSQGLLEHFDQREEVARAHYRALRSGGKALICVPHRLSYHKLWYLCTRPAFLRQWWPWTDQVFLTTQELLALGQAISPSAEVRWVTPRILGIVVLVLVKP